jgi:hypothetical protein
MKHIQTEMEASGKVRVYDKPAIPFERLKASEKVDARKMVFLSG